VGQYLVAVDLTMCAGYERVTSAFLRPGEIKQDRTMVYCLAVCQNFQAVLVIFGLSWGYALGPAQCIPQC